jgi:hypothetical protein
LVHKHTSRHGCLQTFCAYATRERRLIAESAELPGGERQSYEKDLVDKLLTANAGRITNLQIDILEVARLARNIRQAFNDPNVQRTIKMIREEFEKIGLSETAKKDLLQRLNLYYDPQGLPAENSAGVLLGFPPWQARIWFNVRTNRFLYQIVTAPAEAPQRDSNAERQLTMRPASIFVADFGRWVPRAIEVRGEDPFGPVICRVDPNRANPRVDVDGFAVIRDPAVEGRFRVHCYRPTARTYYVLRIFDRNGSILTNAWPVRGPGTQGAPNDTSPDEFRASRGLMYLPMPTGASLRQIYLYRGSARVATLYPPAAGGGTVNGPFGLTRSAELTNRYGIHCYEDGTYTMDVVNDRNGVAWRYRVTVQGGRAQATYIRA